MFKHIKFEDFKFKKVATKEIVEDVVSYVSDWVVSNPGCVVAIGTDSHRRNRQVLYVTTVCMIYPNQKGAHIVAAKHIFKKKQIDLWTRLWFEIEFSRIIATEVQKGITQPVEVHIDINPDVEYQSNKLFQAATGYLRSFGFNVITKPDSYAASSAADILTK